MTNYSIIKTTGIIFIITAVCAGLLSAEAGTNETGFIFNEMRFKYNLMEYTYLLNGKEIKPGVIGKNYYSDTTNSAVVYDEFGRLVFATNFPALTGGIVKISPVEPWIGNWHPRFHIGGGNWLTLGIDYNINRYIWVGGGFGYSYWSDDKLGGSFSILSFSAEGGYYFIGDPSEEFRVGLGGMFAVHLVEPYAEWTKLIDGFYRPGQTVSSNEYRNYGVTLEGLLTMEYDRFFVRLNIRFDFAHPAFLFLPSAGMKF
jgi:hypothetical protein